MGGGRSQMTYSAGSVTTQSIIFKNVVAIEPYRYTPDIQNRSWQVCNTIFFFKTLIALKLKWFWARLKFSLIHNKILGRYTKHWIFHQNNILQYYFSKSVNGYWSSRCEGVLEGGHSTTQIKTVLIYQCLSRFLKSSDMPELFCAWKDWPLSLKNSRTTWGWALDELQKLKDSRGPILTGLQLFEKQ